MPDTFTLFPSEALQIGRYFAEWEPREEIAGIYFGPHFAEWFRRHLGRTVPEMLSSKQVKTSVGELPPDLVWNEEATVAVCNSNPNWLYRRSGDGVVAVSWDDSRKSLLDLLFIHLREHLTLTIFEMVRYWPEQLGLDPHAGLLRRLLENKFDLSGRWAEDRIEAISTALTELANSNGLGIEYDLGIAFGEVFAVCASLQVYYDWNGDAPDVEAILEGEDPSWSGPIAVHPGYVRQRLNDRLTRLLDLSQKGFSENVEASLRYFLDADRFAGTDKDTIKGKEVLSDLRDVVNQAFGQSLYRLQSQDSKARERDMTSMFPRSLPPPVKGDANGDRVAGQLILTKYLLSSAHPKANDPAAILGFIVMGVEATVRDVWPSIGRADPKNSDFIAELGDRVRRGTALESRFAAHALHLTRQYRNPVAHELNTVEVSWAELQHFMHGLAALREMAERLKKRPSIPPSLPGPS